MTLLVTILAILVISTVASAIFVKRHLKPVDVWNIPVEIPEIFSRLDPNLVKLGLNGDLSRRDFEHIFTYFLQGIHSYSSRNRARIIYPGVSGTRGTVVEGLEGFARTAVLQATWLKSGKPKKVELFTGETFDIEHHILTGLIHGTSPTSPEYWGDITHLDQRIVEAADISIAFWLMKDQVKSCLSKDQVDNILTWLAQANNKEIYGGNWHLFLVIINCVLLDIGKNGHESELHKHYQAFKKFHVGLGWFTDGEHGEIDYYNVWQMQYMLFWANQISPSLDPEFIVQSFDHFCEIYQYFIGPNGIPIFGRSCCYRLAAATPLLAASMHHPKLWQGKARLALNNTWSYFLKHGAIKYGRVTQGYFHDDEDLLENYSGRASPLWSLRSLSLAFYLAQDHNFWETEIEQLPIDISSYDKHFDNLKIRITGDTVTGEIVVFPNYKESSSGQKLNTTFKRMSSVRRLIQCFVKRPLRIENYGAKYRRTRYSSRKPFFE